MREVAKCADCGGFFEVTEGLEYRYAQIGLGGFQRSGPINLCPTCMVAVQARSRPIENPGPEEGDGEEEPAQEG